MVLVIGNEITEQRNAQTALIKSEGMLRAVLNNAPNHILSLMNRAAMWFAIELLQNQQAQLLNLLREKVCKSWQNSTPHFCQYAQDYLSDDMTVIETQQAKLIEAQSYTNQEGEKIYMQFRLLPLNIEGQPPMMLGIGTDVTLKNQISTAAQSEQ